MILFGLMLFCTLPAQRKMKDYGNIMKSTSIYEIDAFLRDAHPDDPRRSILKPRLMNLLKDYVKDAHPEDQRVKEMQEKLALLKRRPSTKISFDEMNAIIKQKQIKFYQEELARAQRMAANPGARIKAETPDASPAPAASRSRSSSSSATRTSTAARTGTSSSTAATRTSSAASVSASSYVNPEQAEFDMLMTPTVAEHKQKTVKILNALFDNDPTSKETTVMIKNNSDCDIIVRMESTGNTKYRLAVPSQKENTIVIPKGQYLFESLVCGAQYASQKTVQKAIMVTLGNPGR